jgi:hypothetical protein
MYFRQLAEKATDQHSVLKVCEQVCKAFKNLEYITPNQLLTHFKIMLKTKWTPT